MNPPPTQDARFPLGRLRRGLSFGELALGMLLVVLATRALLVTSSADTYWHLRAGGDIWRTGAAPRLNVYSFTAPDWPWREHEWLWDAVTFACYRVGGMPLVTVCAAAFVIGALALVHRLTVGQVSARFALLALGVSMTIPAWNVRPQVFTLFAVPLLLTLLARDRRWPLAPLFIVPLFLVWANMHGAVALGGLLLGTATAMALFRWWRRRSPEDARRALALLAATPLAAVTCLATPLGTGLFHFLSESMTRIHAVGIGEWQPAVPNEPYGVIFWIAALAFVALVIARRRALADGHASSWADWVLVGSALVLLPSAVAAIRNIPLFFLVAVPAASRLLGAAARIRLPFLARRQRAADADHPMVNLGLLGAAALAALVFVAWSYRTAPPMLGWHPIDERTLTALRSCPGPLYNQYDEGGYLIWFAPEKPVFVDNRQDPYPLEHIKAQLAVQWGAAPYRPLFDRWGIRCAFLPTTSATASALSRDGWVTRNRGDRYSVLSAPEN